MRLSIYALFLTFPFFKVMLYGEVSVVEVPLYVCAFLILGQLGKSKIRLQPSDIAVFVYCLISFIAVVNGMESLHDSARNYRWFVLVPGVIYAVIRLSPMTISELKTGVFLMLPGIILQSMELLRRFIELGGKRALGGEGIGSLVTLSLFFALGLSILIYLCGTKSHIWNRILRWLLFGLMAFLLIITYQRATLVGFIFLLFIVPLTWKSHAHMARFIMVAQIALLVLLLLICTDMVLPRANPVYNLLERQHTFERLFAWDIYLWDAKNRLDLWRTAVAWPLAENPLLGLGMNALSFGKEEGAAMYYGSAHNILVTTIRQGGLLSLAAFLVMLTTMFSALNNIRRSTALLNDMGKFLYLNFVLLLIVALTNDLSGGRTPLLFLLMALIVKVNVNSRRVSKYDSFKQLADQGVTHVNELCKSRRNST